MSGTVDRAARKLTASVELDGYRWESTVDLGAPIQVQGREAYRATLLRDGVALEPAVPANGLASFPAVWRGRPPGGQLFAGDRPGELGDEAARACAILSAEMLAALAQPDPPEPPTETPPTPAPDVRPTRRRRGVA